MRRVRVDHDTIHLPVFTLVEEWNDPHRGALIHLDTSLVVFMHEYARHWLQVVEIVWAEERCAEEEMTGGDPPER